MPSTSNIEYIEDDEIEYEDDEVFQHLSQYDSVSIPPRTNQKSNLKEENNEFFKQLSQLDIDQSKQTLNHDDAIETQRVDNIENNNTEAQTQFEMQLNYKLQDHDQAFQATQSYAQNWGETPIPIKNKREESNINTHKRYDTIGKNINTPKIRMQNTNIVNPKVPKSQFDVQFNKFIGNSQSNNNIVPQANRSDLDIIKDNRKNINVSIAMNSHNFIQGTSKNVNSSLTRSMQNKSQNSNSHQNNIEIEASNYRNSISMTQNNIQNITETNKRKRTIENIKEAVNKSFTQYSFDKKEENKEAVDVTNILQDLTMLDLDNNFEQRFTREYQNKSKEISIVPLFELHYNLILETFLEAGSILLDCNEDIVEPIDLEENPEFLIWCNKMDILINSSINSRVKFLLKQIKQFYQFIFSSKEDMKDKSETFVRYRDHSKEYLSKFISITKIRKLYNIGEMCDDFKFEFKAYFQALDNILLYATSLKRENDVSLFAYNTSLIMEISPKFIMTILEEKQNKRDAGQFKWIESVLLIIGNIIRDFNKDIIENYNNDSSLCTKIHNLDQLNQNTSISSYCIIEILMFLNDFKHLCPIEKYRFFKPLLREGCLVNLLSIVIDDQISILTLEIITKLIDYLPFVHTLLTYNKERSVDFINLLTNLLNFKLSTTENKKCLPLFLKCIIVIYKFADQFKWSIPRLLSFKQGQIIVNKELNVNHLLMFPMIIFMKDLLDYQLELITNLKLEEIDNIEISEMINCEYEFYKDANEYMKLMILLLRMATEKYAEFSSIIYSHRYEMLALIKNKRKIIKDNHVALISQHLFSLLFEILTILDGSHEIKPKFPQSLQWFNGFFFSVELCKLAKDLKVILIKTIRLITNNQPPA